ncbi:MAG: peptidoglycan-binding protein LysM [Flavobacteriaceae bacterium]|nr:peptidoglycan-binding protein LysM [Flavobacteriaceae bacterium]
MTKKFFIYLLVFLAIVSASTFSGRELARFSPLKLEPLVKEFTLHSVPNETESNVNSSMLLVGKSFVDFRNAIGKKESNNNYKSVSKYGYLGKYQFSKYTIRIYGVDNTDDFLSSPELQEKVFKAYVAANKWFLKKEIKHYVGKKINGTLITESGIIAAAHLAGPANVKNYLINNGNIRFQDNFGTSIRHFIKRFEGYDTSVIDAEKNSSIDFYTE